VPHAFSFASPETTYCLVSTVVLALATLYFQRRDQRRAALREVITPADVTGDDKSAETIDLKKQAETEVSPV